MQYWGEPNKRRGRRRQRDRRRWINRLKRRARTHYPGPQPCTMNLHTWAEVRRTRAWYARTYYRTRKRCSDFCCGNPRKFYNTPTPQERRAEDEARVQFQECGVYWKAGRLSKH